MRRNNLDMVGNALPTKNNETPEEIYPYSTTNSHLKLSGTKSLPSLPKSTDIFIFETSSLKKQLKNKFSLNSSSLELNGENARLPTAESIVEELKTVKEIVRDTEQTTDLVCQMLPEDVAKELKDKKYVKPMHRILN